MPDAITSKFNPLNLIPNEVHDILYEVGTPQHLKGYNYIAYGTSLLMNTLDNIPSMTKVVYPSIAEAFNTESTRVERAIRHAIENTFDHVDRDIIIKLFGNSADPNKGKIVNSQFLVAMAHLANRRINFKNS